MANTQLSTKRIQISKTTAVIVGAIAAASFVTVFSLIASQALISQRSYQSRVIAGKEKAKKQLEANIKAVESLRTQFKAFQETGGQNILGGNPNGNGERDGDNARIVLDALPSKYDYPALATSLEKILSTGGLSSGTVSGTDDEIAQNSSQTNTTAAPKQIPIPFQLTVSGKYSQVQNFIGVLERSIRPIQIQKITLGGSEDQMSVGISAITFYQPSKGLNITTTEVK